MINKINKFELIKEKKILYHFIKNKEKGGNPAIVSIIIIINKLSFQWLNRL